MRKRFTKKRVPVALDLRLKDTYSLSEWGLGSPKEMDRKISWNGSETDFMNGLADLIRSGRNRFTLKEIEDFIEVVYPSWMVCTQENPDDFTPIEVYNADQAEKRYERLLGEVSKLQQKLEDPTRITDRRDALYSARLLAKKWQGLRADGVEGAFFDLVVRQLNYLVQEFKLEPDEVYL